MQLDTLLADWRSDATALRRQGHERDASHLEQRADQVAEAAEPYLRWLSEADAHLYSGRSVKWLRSRFPEWEAQGNASRDRGQRRYRMMVLPVRANLAAAVEDAKRTAQGEAA